MLPFGSFRIGRIFGIDVEINYTWFAIFILVTVALTLTFQEKPYQLSPLASLVDGVITSLLFFVSVLLHELCHSIVARLNGIPIKKITLFIFGGVAQMSKEPDSPGVEFKMAIAGPSASFLLALIFGLTFWSFQTLSLSRIVIVPFIFLAEINLALGLFNLAPGFPLDGGRVLRAALWYWYRDLERATRIAAGFGQGVAGLLILIGFLSVIMGNLGGIWFILLGWFLNQASQASYKQLVLQRSLSGIKVEGIMTKEVQTVEPSLTLDQVVNEHFLRYKFGRFPVVEDERLLGVITLHDVKEIPRENWSTTTVWEAMDPLDERLKISPGEDAVQALMQMAKEEVGHLLVVEDDRLVGLVTRADIIKLIKVKTELGV